MQYRVKDIASVILSENSLTCAHVQRMAQKQGGEKKCGDVCTVGFIFWPYLGTYIVNLKNPISTLLYQFILPVSWCEKKITFAIVISKSLYFLMWHDRDKEEAKKNINSEPI